MTGDEARVVDIFAAWLTEHGWSVETEKAFCDITARRDDVTLYAEAKGHTSSAGLDIDTLYGQLLRRSGATSVGEDILAVVVPDDLVRFAERVPVAIRDALNAHVYGVAADGVVTHHGDRQDPASTSANLSTV